MITGSETVILDTVSAQEKNLWFLLLFLKIEVESREKCEGSSRDGFGTNLREGTSNYERQ